MPLTRRTCVSRLQGQRQRHRQSLRPELHSCPPRSIVRRALVNGSQSRPPAGDGAIGLDQSQAEMPVAARGPTS